MNNNKKNIILIGHTGSGKSIIGYKLSKNLKKKFFDSDLEIEKFLDMKINKIFKIFGENFFRKKETYIINDLLNKNNIILSTGGGIVEKSLNINILKKLGIIIYFKCDLYKCINRIINLNDRPLLIKYKKNNDIKKFIYEKFKKREYIYENISNIKIDTNKKTINEIIKDILYILKTFI